MIENEVRPERIASKCICCGSKSLNKSPAILMPFVAKRIFDWDPVEITDEWGLRTIKNGMAYPLCNSLSCVDCGVIFLDIRFDDSEMASLYSGYRDDRYTNLRESLEPGYRARNAILNQGSNYISQIESFLKPYLNFPLKILDWGGDTGINTPFRNSTNVVHVFEISKKPMVENAICVSKDELAKHDYDLVVISNVLEHVPSPLEVLKELKGSMKSGSVLYIEVPFEDLVRNASKGEQLVSKKKHWHEHINFFTEESLRVLVKRTGLNTLAMKPMAVHVGGMDKHILSLACSMP